MRGYQPPHRRRVYCCAILVAVVAGGAVLGMCRSSLRLALLREQMRCRRCMGSNRSADRQDLCHDCIMELGMPIYQRLTADKRLRAQAKQDAEVEETLEQEPVLLLVDGGLE